MFPEQTRKIVTMLSHILGHFTDENVDESILGLFYIFSLDQPLIITFNFAPYLSDSIHEKLVKLPVEGVFKYPSILFHMFLFFHSEWFAISL